jgi:antitoxin component HigA of HigAB toxin-antitoxin module
VLTSKRGHRTKRPGPLHKRSASLKASVYRFPRVQGLEDVSAKMAHVKAETLFSALMKGYDLSPIENEEQARWAEKFLEYLLRAFEKKCPEPVKTYVHLLEMLIEEFDKQHTVPAAHNIAPHRLLKTMLEEAGLTQKALVPACFKSASQVSEFLSQKKGREKLTAQQAIMLGHRFHLDPLLFISKKKK